MDFLHVYIREAHATDQWPLGYAVQFEQHKTQGYRIECAKKCWADLDWKMPSVTDHIDNDFNNAYAAWPERFFIVHEGRMQYIAYPEDASYDPTEITRWIEDFKAHMTTVVAGAAEQSES